jgi:hypothetical protein
MKAGTLAVVAVLASTACHASFRDARYPAGEEKTKWAHFYVFGVVGHAEIDVRDHCPSGYAREVYLSSDILTVGATILTLGIYVPRKVTITCAKSVAAK